MDVSGFDGPALYGRMLEQAKKGAAISRSRIASIQAYDGARRRIKVTLPILRFLTKPDDED